MYTLYSIHTFHYMILTKHDQKTTNMMRSALSIAVFVRTVTHSLTLTHAHTTRTLSLWLSRYTRIHMHAARATKHTYTAKAHGKKLNALSIEFSGTIWSLGRTRSICVGLCLSLAGEPFSSGCALVVVQHHYCGTPALLRRFGYSHTQIDVHEKFEIIYSTTSS